MLTVPVKVPAKVHPETLTTPSTAGRIAHVYGYSAAFVMAAMSLCGAAIVGRWVFAGAGHESHEPVLVTPDTSELGMDL